jgi:HD-like signal output (HDOD) protein
MTSILNEKELKHILQGISIPPQPQILVDLQMEQAMPDPDISYIVSAIAQDVSISAAVLKFINSAYYNLETKLSSIQQAVIMLGPNRLANILSNIAVRNELTDERIKSLHSFWDTTTDVAMISGSIAEQLNFKYKDECYALGLFHNAGIPLMLKRFNNYKDVLVRGYQDPNLNITDLENQIFKTNHSVVGYFLAKSWGLPKSCCSVIAKHHRVERLFTNRVPGDNLSLTFAAILKMAEHIASVYKHIGEANEDYEWQRISHYALDYLNLTEYDLENITEVCHEQGIGTL